VRIKLFSLSLLFIFLFGCTAPLKHYLQYDIVLEEVKRPVEEKEPTQEQLISTAEVEGFQYMFEDKMIRISWLPSPVELRFLVENKTNHSLKILWNEAAFICQKGKTHRVMHAGVKYIDRNEPQLPTVIEGKEAIEDYIYPVDYVTYSSDGWIERPLMGAGWSVKPLFPYSKKGGDPQEFLNNAKSHIGKTMKVLLPVQSEEKSHYYTFTFKVNDVNLAPKQDQTTDEGKSDEKNITNTGHIPSF
jgi:hypothetical protein